jgi:hypothetical protein
MEKTIGIRIGTRLATPLARAPHPGETQPAIDAGLTVGRTIGTAVAAWAATDGALQTPLPPNPGGPGSWRGSNPIPGLVGARLLSLQSANQFLPPPTGARSETRRAFSRPPTSPASTG